MDLTEGTGESCSPPRSMGSFSYDVRNDVFNRLKEIGNQEAVSNPDSFREQLDSHFHRLPISYGLDVNVDRAEDILLHRRLLAEAKDPEKRPVFHIRFLENICTWTESNGDQFINVVSTASPVDEEDGAVPSHKRIRDSAVDFEPCSKLEDLNLDVRKTSKGIEDKYLIDNASRRKEIVNVPTHEVIFSTVDKPKLLSQLSALLSDIGLNIREAHVFSTTDGYSLDVFVVDGWPIEDIDGLYKAMEKAIAKSEGSWSGGSSHLQLAPASTSDKTLTSQLKTREWEIDRRLLKIRDRIAAGSCGDLYRGVYLGQDVAVKIFRSEQLTDAQQEEFAQEISILREVQHRNVVRFIGACTNSPQLCIVTEYMPGGNLYDYLHKNHSILKLPQLLKFSIDVCKGMGYLHQNNIIHRDLKTANLLMDANEVVKVADFGVARFQSQEGVMTAETGTYRWMAPEINYVAVIHETLSQIDGSFLPIALDENVKEIVESITNISESFLFSSVINHQPYDQKADVFSFAIVLWELLTAKVPYDAMTPLQAALGVRQGLRPDLPKDVHPKLLDLMQRCWEAVPADRPSFSEITIELQLLQEVQEISEAVNGY